MHRHSQSPLINRIHSIPIQILCFTMLKHTNKLCFNPYLFTMYSIAWSIAMPMYILCLSMPCPCITYANAMLSLLYIHCIYAIHCYHSYTLCIIVYRCSLSSCSYAINAVYTYNVIHSPRRTLSNARRRYTASRCLYGVFVVYLCNPMRDYAIDA